MNKNSSRTSPPTRRRFLGSIATPLAVPMAAWMTGDAFAAEELPPLNRFPRMVHEYFVDQVRQSQRRNLLAGVSVKTTEDSHKYVEEVRRKIRECFGPEPERTPLNLRITGVVELPNSNASE